MFTKTAALALVAAIAGVQAVPQGFNYASTNGDGSARTQSDFESLFKGAQNLQGTSGFNAARLYTMIQGGTQNSPIAALQAAMDSQTYLLLGLWASGDGFENEVTALKSALSMDGLSKYILGISVGSEDLYRISPTGLTSPGAGPGQEPSTLVSYIKEVRDALKGSSWSNIPVGHVDTWTAWVNGSNSDVISNVDFLGVDAYPYFQNTEANGINNGASLFNEALHNTQGVAGGKDVWITETGFPISGPVENQATPGFDNAKTYWDQVGCPNFGKTPTFWYTLDDGLYKSQTSPSFAVADMGNNYKPYFDLSCSNVTTNSTSSSSTSTASGSASASAVGASSGFATATSASGSGNGTYSANPTPTSAGTASGSGSGSSSGSSSGSGSGSSGSGSSGSGSSGSSTGSSSGSKTSGAAAISTGAAPSMGAYSAGSVIAFVAGIAALL